MAKDNGSTGSSERPQIEHLELKGVTKRFPGVLANDRVDFDVRAGEVHALLGENGAGKSTLMKVLYGMYAPDEGEIWINGSQASIASPTDAIEKGIGMIHQHFMLVETLTVAENVSLGLPSSRGPLTDLDRVSERILELADVYGLRVDQVDSSAGLADANPNPAMPMYSANMAYMTYYGTKAEDQTETNVGGLLRYEIDLDYGVTLFTGLSRTVRTADATERYMNKWSPNPADRWIGNPDIDPEQHHQVDLGVLKQGGSHSLSATLFYDDVSDYILRDYAPDQAQIYRNIDAELYGLEVEGTWRLRPGLDLTAALAYVHATNTTDDRPIAQTPPLGGKVQLDYYSGRWTHGARVRFADSQDRTDPESPLYVGETAGWGVFDFYGSYAMNETFSLRWGIDNLFDKTYAEHASRSNLMDLEAVRVNEPGRVAWLKLTAAF